MRIFIITAAAATLSVFTLVTEGQTARVTTNRAGGSACLTKEAYNELTKASIHAQKTKDTSWVQSIFDSRRCFNMRKGLQVTIKDFGFLGLSEIYLHPSGGGAPVAVWTANENFTN